MGHFYQVMYHSSGGLRAPPVKSVADFLRYLLQDRKLQPKLINWEIHPSTSVRTEISLVSWIVSSETDIKAGVAYPPELLTGRAPAKTPFDPIKEAPLKRLTFKTVFLLAFGSGKCKSEIHAWQTDILDANPIGQRCPCIHHPAFYPRISWP